MVRQKICFFGRVQGVGFRYTMASFAKTLGITGWCKNEWNGSVKAEVQGNPADISKLIELLQEDPYIKIEYMEREIIPVIEKEKEFKISRFY